MVRIIEDRCIGCGICADICPTGIEIVNNMAKIKNINAACLKDAALSCPKKAIMLEDEIYKDEGTIYNSIGTGLEKGQGMGRGAGKGMGMGKGMGIGPRDGRGKGRGGGKGRGSF